MCMVQVMTSKEREVITDIRKCNFNELAEYYKRKSEERKNMSKEEKQVCLSVCLCLSVRPCVSF